MRALIPDREHLVTRPEEKYRYVIDDPANLLPVREFNDCRDMNPSFHRSPRERIGETAYSHRIQ